MLSSSRHLIVNLSPSNWDHQTLAFDFVQGGPGVNLTRGDMMDLAKNQKHHIEISQRRMNINNQGYYQLTITQDGVTKFNGTNLKATILPSANVYFGTEVSSKWTYIGDSARIENINIANTYNSDTPKGLVCFKNTLKHNRKLFRLQIAITVLSLEPRPAVPSMDFVIATLDLLGLTAENAKEYLKKLTMDFARVRMLIPCQ